MMIYDLLKFVVELKSLATEVMGLMEQRVGASVYFQARHQVERHQAKVRSERRQVKRLRAVMDPQAHAQRKIEKNQMKRNARKRKVEEYSKYKMKQGVKKVRTSYVDQ